MSLSRNLYRAARIARDVEVIESGDPRKMNRRIKNVMLGRLLGRAGVWRFIWK